VRIRLEHSQYGATSVRLLRVSRQGNRHEIKDATIAVAFEGDFAAAYTTGDNSKILPYDTIRNTICVLAKQYSPEPIEEFSSHLIEHFLTYNPQVSRARVETRERIWERIRMGARPHENAFARSGAERRTALLIGTRNELEIWAGIDNLAMLKSGRSGFEGFLSDPYTTLKARTDRELAGSLTASWRYAGGDIAYSSIWHGVRQTLLEVFADHESRSPQQTLYAMGEAGLRNFELLTEIRLSLLVEDFNAVDFSPFGMQNANEVLVPANESRGLVEAVLRRDM
jgi:urate oxidase